MTTVRDAEPGERPGHGALSPADLALLLGQPEPTAEQAAVVSAPLGPAVVVAGAGSGKSETMASRVVWLVANGYVRPEHILGLTFTRKAATELAERVRNRLDQLRETQQVPAGLLDGDPDVSTYNSYAARLVSDHALREAIEPATRLLSPGQAWQLAEHVVRGYDGPMDAITVKPDTVVSRVLDLAGELSDHLREPDDVRDVGHWIAERVEALSVDTLTKKEQEKTRRLEATQRKREQLLPLVERYNTAKTRREVMDYGDQVALAARIATRHPGVGELERSRYRVVLLDEYQDTSHAQLLLLRALFGGGHPVTAVGDPCQSIYGWRGASAGNLAGFGTDFPQASGDAAPVLRLATSFRNGERILHAAKRVSEPLRGAAPPDSGTAAGAETGTSAADVPVLQPGPDRHQRGTVACALFHTETEEAEWLADTIETALEQPARLAPDGAPWPGGGETPLSPKDVAVLCRKRSQFPLVREALEKRGVPVEVVGLGGLLTVPEVRDIVATLRVLHDATAGNELARLLTGPRWRIGPRDLVALGGRATELARESRRDLTAEGATGEEDEAEDLLQRTVLDLTAESGSLVDALDDPGPAERYSALGYERLTALAAELRGLRRMVNQPLPDLITEVERTLSLDIEVGARTGRDPMAARSDLDAFVDAAVRFVGNSDDPTLATFLSYLRSAEEAEQGLAPGERVGESDTVKLMTIHGAKGLQWPVVAVPGMAGGPYPVFPTTPRDLGGWVTRESKLPFSLRGDSGGLPSLDDVDRDSLERFLAADRQRHLAEERRLAYVAVTRASFALLCSGHWWGHAAASKRGPSTFLTEVREACDTGAGWVARWADPPEEGEHNPQITESEPVAWPQHVDEYEESAAERHRRTVEGAQLVAQARARDEDGIPEGRRWLDSLERAETPPAMRRRLEGWNRDTELLLAHQNAEADATGSIPVELPAHLSVSSLVALARDPDGLARRIRRPLPRPPAPHTRRGTAFHTWLEQRYGQQSLLDPAELPGAADESAAEDPDLDELQRRFEESEWAGLTPLDVEVPFETIIGDRLVRGRMDAVFHDSGSGRYDVVDWKTGRAPANERERSAVAVQLAAYRSAWAELAGVPLEDVRAAFHYVRSGETVRPADLLDADGLAALLDTLPQPE
ncbi:DNA helicase-2/ATP-dependent DNA helicase PcrA [Haloactinospora alba]|uniref:DNA 3'-5' helicase n=1 Tax=Haloactinospora alba TaxID=405555 RepID=A0A543NF79_9ACTN|nr:ATP-dependent DNA helicase [Haloactinospora alba]TQN30484.1 DNA helicase-2/ATP-dependent DNA helicase PcrA [Haloactinospora alba]